MAQDANGIFSSSIGVTPQGVSINDSRRIFNFGERVAELSLHLSSHIYQHIRNLQMTYLNS